MPWNIREPGSLLLADSGFLGEDLVIDAGTLERITTRFREALGDQMPASLGDDLVIAHVASPDVHAVNEPVNQLRDPCLFCDHGDGTWWLFYAVAGESGIAVARL